MSLRLRYGSGHLDLSLPDGVLVERPVPVQGGISLSGAARASNAGSGLAGLQSAGFPSAVAGRRLGLLVADTTRPAWPREDLTAILELCERAASIDLFVCTGTHASASPELERLEQDLRAASAAALPDSSSPDVHVHDCADEHRLAGRTGRGTPVEIDVRTDGCDLFLVLAEMRPHYFAGYSNPTKYLVPGLASAETARANHRLALEPLSRAAAHPLHSDPARRANPLAEDLLEAARLVLAGRPAYALVCVGDPARRVFETGGELEAVIPPGIAAVDRWLGYEARPASHVIIGAGGHPWDESLYTAQRALECCAEVLAPGASVLFLARCTGGLGPAASRAGFFEPLRALGPPREAPSSGPGSVAAFRAAVAADYRMYAHKAVKFAERIAGTRDLALVSDLPPHMVAAMHLRPVSDPSAWIEALPRQKGPLRLLVCEQAAERHVRAALLRRRCRSR